VLNIIFTAWKQGGSMKNSITIDRDKLIEISEKYEGLDGLAYFIITEYCKENNLSFRERINWLKETKKKLCAVTD
jgi:hypothetical protein